MKRMFLKSMISVLVSFSAVTACSAVSRNSNKKESVYVNKFEVRYDTPIYRKMKKLKRDFNGFAKDLAKEIKKKENIETKKLKEMEILRKDLSKDYLNLEEMKRNVLNNVDGDESILFDVDDIDLKKMIGDSNESILLYPDSINFIKDFESEDEKKIKDLEKIISQKENKFSNLKKELINTKEEIQKKIDDLRLQHSKKLNDIKENKEDALDLSIGNISDNEINEFITKESQEKEREILFEDTYKEILAFCMVLDDMTPKIKIPFYDVKVRELFKDPVNAVVRDILRDATHNYISDNYISKEKKLIFYNKNGEDKEKLKSALSALHELRKYNPTEIQFLCIKEQIINLIKEQLEEYRIKNRDEANNKNIQFLNNQLEKIKNIKFEDIKNLIKNLRVERFPISKIIELK